MRNLCVAVSSKMEHTIKKSKDIDKIGKPLTNEEKKAIEKAVRKTVREYGEVLKMLGKS